MASENYVVDEELLRMRDILLRRTLTYQIFQLYLKYEDKLQTAQLILVEIALPAFILGINRLSFGWKTTVIRLVFFMCLVFVVYVSAMSGLRKKYLNYDGKVAQVLARTAFFLCHIFKCDTASPYGCSCNLPVRAELGIFHSSKSGCGLPDGCTRILAFWKNCRVIVCAFEGSVLCGLSFCR